MRQRGRKSAAGNLVVLRPNGDPPRLTAPSTLTKPEHDLFNEIVAGIDVQHFVRADLPLLVSYVQATLLARRAVRGPLDDWERAVRVQAMLATKLRLSPQTRTQPKVVGRRAQDGPPAVGSLPWDSKYDG